MYIGIDLGTSGVKAVLIDERQTVAAYGESLSVSRPQPLWSEQDPADWWHAVDRVMSAMKMRHDLSAVKAIGLTGQMHGATLLDKQRRVLRPAILWNDGRSAAQCAELEKQVPDSRRITGNLMMPGFTAPKLKWIQQYEPTLFKQIDKVLLPKDYLRLCLTGECASDMSDASGTLWLDVAHRRWSEPLLAACGLSESNMPRLLEGNQISGELLPEIAERWGLKTIPVVAGGGDNAAGAIGVGLYQAGQAMLSLGTSGVYFAVSDGYLSNPERAVHSFCHALPDTWHLMSVILSAASCLDWVCRLTGFADVATLLAEVENTADKAPPVWFLPYLSGERTPYNNPDAKGAFWGLSHQHGAVDLARAVLEGVGFALADGMDALHATGLKPKQTIVIGGGGQSAYWRQMLANISGQTLEYRRDGEVGPALGAARLAQIALNPAQSLSQLCPELPLLQLHRADKAEYQRYSERRKIFKSLYQQLLPLC
jgi:xylulokinase